ncbi:hypothetical protein LEP1GSC170_0375, partial [Leptospira interrogans serovar Bataviae str. HAI135]
HSLGEGSSKLVVINSGYPVGDKYDVWVEAASEGWEEEGKHLKDYLKNLERLRPLKRMVKRTY